MGSQPCRRMVPNHFDTLPQEIVDKIKKHTHEMEAVMEDGLQDALDKYFCAFLSLCEAVYYIVHGDENDIPFWEHDRSKRSECHFQLIVGKKWADGKPMIMMNNEAKSKWEDLDEEFQRFLRDLPPWSNKVLERELGITLPAHVDAKEGRDKMKELKEWYDAWAAPIGVALKKMEVDLLYAAASELNKMNARMRKYHKEMFQ